MDAPVRFNLKMKLMIGFLIFFIVSGVIPVIVALFVDILDLGSEAADFLIPLLSFGVSLIICVIVGLYLRKWIASPINKLVRATEQMARGNLAVDTQVETGDEIESFAGSLSRMRSSLQIAIDMLGPPEIKEFTDGGEIRGLSIGEKIIFALLLFLILNPIVTGIPLLLFDDPSAVEILGISVLPLLFSIMLVAIFVFHLNNSIMNPFIRLTAAADSISKGDFTIPIEVRSKGDVGRLEHNFKLITERIQRAMEELEDA